LWRHITVNVQPACHPSENQNNFFNRCLSVNLAAFGQPYSLAP
jgi:hypothetical protein